MIDHVSFHKVKKVNSLIGFTSFYYNDIGFQEIAVHKLLHPKNGVKIRLLYPDKVIPHSKMQQDIDSEISAYISANYKDILG